MAQVQHANHKAEAMPRSERAAASSRALKGLATMGLGGGMGAAMFVERS